MFESFDKLNGEIKTRLKFVRQDKVEEVYDKMIEYNKKIIEVPCNHCIECFQEHSKEWTYRIMCEASYYKYNCMITLTYANTNGELCKRDLQLFLKRLRKKLSPQKIRYFACGEYGSKGQRPHFHIILFNYKPSDLKLFKHEKTYDVFISKEVSEIWKNGFISVLELNEMSIKYCSKYLQKFNNYKNKKVKPFIVMSNRPGIGYKYFMENKEVLVKTDKIIFNGNYLKLPRYFQKLAILNGFDLTQLKENREKKYKLIKPYINLENKRYFFKQKYNKIVDKYFIDML